MTTIQNRWMILFKIIKSMPCFFKEVTHFYCPACGGTRSVMALLHLDIKRAFLCNPTVIYAGVMLLWCFFGYIIKKLTGTQIKIMKPQLWINKGDCIAICAAAVPEVIYLMLSCSKIGAIANFINPLFTNEQKINLINNTNATLIYEYGENR